MNNEFSLPLAGGGVRERRHDGPANGVHVFRPAAPAVHLRCRLPRRRRDPPAEWCVLGVCRICYNDPHLVYSCLQQLSHQNVDLPHYYADYCSVDCLLRPFGQSFYELETNIECRQMCRPARDYSAPPGQLATVLLLYDIGQLSAAFHRPAAGGVSLANLAGSSLFGWHACEL